MKRSKAENEIALILDNAFPGYDWDKHEFIAEQILSRLLEIGMLPPASKHVLITTGNQYIRKLLRTLHENHKWEPETVEIVERVITGVYVQETEE